MSQAQAYKDIMAAVQSAVDAHTAYPLAVESDNRNAIDQATQNDPYLKVEIVFLDGDQIELGETNVLMEQWGQVWLCAVCKDGTGALRSLELLDFMRPYFERKRLGTVTCRAVTSVKPKEVKGLWHTPAIVNFYYHRTS
jgi:hypothetical protein